MTVDMANVEGFPHDGQAAVGRAKAILVQTASFDLAATGTTPKATAISTSWHLPLLMTRVEQHIFEYRGGEGSRKIPPGTMPSLDAAHAELFAEQSTF